MVEYSCAPNKLDFELIPELAIDGFLGSCSLLFPFSIMVSVIEIVFDYLLFTTINTNTIYYPHSKQVWLREFANVRHFHICPRLECHRLLQKPLDT